MAKNMLSEDIQSHLSGLEFPVNKQGAISHAKDKNAPHEVITALNGIPDREYTDVEDLMKEIDSR
jgi:hypothetical protein